MRDVAIHHLFEAPIDVTLNDVHASIDALTKYRDTCPRGSARRADFANSIKRLRAWQHQLERQLEKVTEAEATVKRAKVKGRASNLKEGIVHFDRAKVTTIIPLVRKLLDASGDLEVTEKVDGSPLRAGVVDGRFYTSTKHGMKVFDVDAPKAYDAAFLRPFQDVHEKLSGSSFASIVKKFARNNEATIRKQVPDFDPDSSDIELAFEFIRSRSNVIAYDPQQVGEGVLIILNIVIDGKSIIRTPVGQQLIDALKEQLDSKLKVRTMAFYDITDARGALNVDVIKSFEEVERELIAAGDVTVADVGKRAQPIIDAIRDALISNWVDLQDKNMLGGTEIEGLVIHDSQTGDTVKLVNRDKYTQRGKDLWKFRNTSAAAFDKFRKDVVSGAFSDDKLLVDLVTQAPSSTFKKRHGSISSDMLKKRVRQDDVQAEDLIRQLKVFEETIDTLWSAAERVHKRLRERAKTPAEQKVVDDNANAEREQYDMLRETIRSLHAAVDDPYRFIELITPKSRWMKKLTNESRRSRSSAALIAEGGHAFDDVEPVTLDEYDDLWSDIVTRLSNIGITSVEPIGSTGKKAVMGDIDIAIEVQEGTDVGSLLRDEFGSANVRPVGAVYSVRWPFIDKYHQVDIMVGQLSYLRWSRFGTGDATVEQPHPVRGMYRNLLLNTLARIVSSRDIDDEHRERLAIDFDRGLRKIKQRRSKSGWKRVGDAVFVSADPDEITKHLFGDIVRVETFQQLVKAIRVSPKTRDIANVVFDEFIGELVELGKRDKRIDMTTVENLRKMMLDENLKLAASLLAERDATGAGGFAYEDVVLKAIKKAGVSGTITKSAGADASRPDADIKVNGKIYPVEVKLDANAQMGGTSIRWKYGKRQFTFMKALDPVVQEMIVDAMRPIIKDLKAFVDYIKRHPGNRDVTGFPMTVTKDSWSKAQRTGRLAPLNVRLDHNAAFIVNHYNRKGVNYIQIGGAGLFYMGSNPANLPVPALTGDISIEVRAARGGSSDRKSDGRKVGTANIRVQARLKSKGKSPYTLDDPKSIKAMLKAQKSKAKMDETLAHAIK